MPFKFVKQSVFYDWKRNLKRLRLLAALSQGRKMRTKLPNVFTKTDFKFIGKVESQTNNKKKISSCSFHMKLFQKPNSLFK